MSDIFLFAAGGLAMLSGVGHNYLGATKIVGPSVAPNRSAKTLMHAIWFLSGLYWFAAGALLIATPLLFTGDVRKWVIFGCIGVLGSTGILNLLFMQFRHFGGYLLTLVTILAWAGI